MAHWYIKQDDKILGPFGPAALREQVDMGNVHADTMLRKGSDGHFLAAQSFKGLLTDASIPDTDEHALTSKVSSGSDSSTAKRKKSKSVNAEIQAALVAESPSAAITVSTAETQIAVTTEMALTVTTLPDSCPADSTLPISLLRWSKIYLIAGCIACIVCLICALRS